MKRDFSVTYIFISLLSLLFAAGCAKDPVDDPFSIGKGECTLDASVEFTPLTPALNGATRTAGTAIRSINTLCVLLYDTDGKLVGKYPVEKFEESNVERENSSTEKRTPRAEFKLKVPYGRYFAYVVANMGDLSGYADRIGTVEGLKNVSFVWQNKVADNAQMFGQFDGDDQGLVTIDRSNLKLHAWIRRAASKVTVAFDGSRLEKGVFIYLKSVQIKDIPASCLLGNPNTPTDAATQLISEGEKFDYTETTAYDDTYPARITWERPYYPCNPVTYELSADAHSDDNPASLFFYENMQGKGESKRQDWKNPGHITYPEGNEPGKPGFKDNKPCGTYVEVEAFYHSEHPDRPGSGTIKYRFMLGKDTETDYNAERNYHYKLTLMFNRFANDADWHIEYKEQVLEVTQPKVFNYQGKVFMPVPKDVLPNFGHTFSGDNVITVTSHEGTLDKPGSYRNFTVSYREKGQTAFSDECDWLHWSIDAEKSTDTEKVLKFTADTSYVEIDIDARLLKAQPKGGDTSPYNLADPGGSADYVKCTANCYMIDAPGCYILPLVYGNAIHNGETNENSYKYMGAAGTDILPVFKNHLDNGITNPYIKDNAGCNPASASLVWQDEQNLVTGVEYVPGAYGGKGGIKFKVNQGSIKQGNAVIAVKDNIGRVMWSWHIWVTRFDFEKTITVTGHDAFRKFELMPVNLGWCSDHGEKIRYYKRRECEVKFTAGDLSKTITIVQEPHTAFSRGNSPYYQWGRKDPFIGSNANEQNKPRWDGEGNSYDETAANNPRRFYDDYMWDWKLEKGKLSRPLKNEDGSDAFDSVRRTSREDLYRMILNPDTWHNPPRKKSTIVGQKYESVDKTYANLWEGRRGVEPDAPTLKTVYDPCPVGYQVSHYNAFSGFTTTGDDTNYAPERYDVQIDNIAPGNPTEQLYEFYTDSCKVQSIIFPQTGYRDWDNCAFILNFGTSGFVWAAGNVKNDDLKSYNFMFERATGLILPKNSFYHSDGFPVRPCVYDKHGSD